MPNCYNEFEHIIECCNNLLTYKTDCKVWVAFMYHIYILRYYSSGHLCNILDEYKIDHGLKDLTVYVCAQLWSEKTNFSFTIVNSALFCKQILLKHKPLS